MSNTPSIDPEQLRLTATEVLRSEAQAIDALVERIGDAFIATVHRILDCDGHLIVTGMGKSGHIGHKLAATLASTGTPAFFVHPAEASHGDLGMIRSNDLLLALSNSGETSELLALLPVIKRLGVGLIALTGNPGSTLAGQADLHIDVSVGKEACPLGLAPTASTAAQLAMGDALALAVLQARGFTAEDFARSHPGGRLGRQLLVRIADIMHSGDALPLAGPTATLAEVIVEMTRCRLGFCALADAQGRVVGVITDGDLRRNIDRITEARELLASDIMSANPQCIDKEAMAVAAAEQMQRYKIQGLVVIDDQQRPIGALNFQDLLQAGVV